MFIKVFLPILLSASFLNIGPGFTGMLAQNAVQPEAAVQVSDQEMIREIVDTAFSGNEITKNLETAYLNVMCGHMTNRTLSANGATFMSTGVSVPVDKKDQYICDLRLVGTARTANTSDGTIYVEFDPSGVETNRKDLRYIYDLILDTKEKTQFMSDQEKINYAFTKTKELIPVYSMEDDSNVTVCNAIRLGNGRCGSSNQLMSLILNASGIRTRVITGSYRGRHAWCRIELNGTHYHLDAVGLVPNMSTDEQTIAFMSLVNLPD